MFSENSYLYHMHEFHKASVAPLRMAAKMCHEVHSNSLSPLSYAPFSRQIAASCKLLERITRRYYKPEWGLTHTVIDGNRYKVTEKTIGEKHFCNLINFQRATNNRRDPKMLIVAPMSGHHATLLRGTVEALIPHFDVYVTDWIDAREVPLYEGAFHLDDYIDYVMEYLELLGPEVHVMAVCQPAVPVMAAVSLLNEHNPKKAPRSMTLMGGPIDTRIKPTEVNDLAEKRELEWFRTNVITRVPFNYPGFMRRVYPGFVQLSGFMQMNLERHIGEHVKLFNHLVEGDGDSAEAHKDFYNEYLAVMDLPAEFYLETIHTVFQEHALPRGKMKWRGKKVKPAEIKHTALLTVEGERDDISGVGQTEAAHTLCAKLPKSMKTHYLQKEVGHYGIFNGRRFREQIVPKIVDHVYANDRLRQPDTTKVKAKKITKTDAPAGKAVVPAETMPAQVTSATKEPAASKAATTAKTKATVKKAPAKKTTTAKKATVTKTARKKSATKKPATAKKTTATKPATKRSALKKTTAKKASATKKSTTAKAKSSTGTASKTRKTSTAKKAAPKKSAKVVQITSSRGKPPMNGAGKSRPRTSPPAKR